MADEMTNLLSEIAPDLKDGTPVTAPSDKKTIISDTEIEAEDGADEEGVEGEGEEELDYDNATPEQQKEWPKPFKNALSKAKKERVKALAEKRELEQQLAELRRAQQQPPAKKEEPPVDDGAPKVTKEMKAILDKKPKLEDFKTWGEYNEALVKWTSNVTKQELKEEGTVERQKEKDGEQKALALQKNRERIVTQAKELMTEFPGYIDLLKANASHLESFPEHVAEAFRESENPAIAFVVLAENEGALERLAKMTPIKAAQFIGQAEYIGLQQLRAYREQKANSDGSGAEGAGQAGKEGKRASSAPAPMRTAKSGTSGRKALDQMSADDLAKSPEFADVFK